MNARLFELASEFYPLVSKKFAVPLGDREIHIVRRIIPSAQGRDWPEKQREAHPVIREPQSIAIF